MESIVKWVGPQEKERGRGRRECVRRMSWPGPFGAEKTLTTKEASVRRPSARQGGSVFPGVSKAQLPHDLPTAKDTLYHFAVTHSPRQVSWGRSLSTMQGSFPSCNWQITFGIANGIPAHEEGNEVWTNGPKSNPWTHTPEATGQRRQHRHFWGLGSQGMHQKLDLGSGTT